MLGEASQRLESVPGHKEYLSVIFRRCVLALIWASMPENAVLERRMIEHFVTVAEDYFLDLIKYLQRLTLIQRRSAPSLSDVALMLHFNQLNVLDLISELKRTPLMEESKPVATLNALYFDPEEASLDALQVPFFEKPKLLVQPARQRPAYIPNWMPSLPPEHTYMHTSSHYSEVKDLRSVRMSLVEEGSLAELALQRLLGDRGSSSMIELPKEPKVRHKKSILVVDGQSKEDVLESSNNSGENTSKASVGSLRLQLHLPKPEPSTGKLSLKLSLGKKKSQSSIVGKRPRVDIVKLAQQRTKDLEVSMEVDTKYNEQEPLNDDLSSFYTAALSSYAN